MHLIALKQEAASEHLQLLQVYFCSYPETLTSLWSSSGSPCSSKQIPMESTACVVSLHSGLI